MFFEFIFNKNYCKYILVVVSDEGKGFVRLFYEFLSENFDNLEKVKQEEEVTKGNTIWNFFEIY